MSKEIQHTPGPWTDCYDSTIRLEADESIVIAQCYAPNLVIASGVWEQVRANARLIAAAPELLAACEEVDEYLKCEGTGYQYVCGVTYTCNNCQASRILRAAIAKAKGGDA